MSAPLQLDGHSLTIADVAAVADAYRPVRLAPAATARMQQSRNTVEGLASAGAAVYGINTGFGKLSEVTIPHEQLAALQRNLVRSHAAGVGDPLPEREVRAMMLLRANVLATGYAGARAEVVETLRHAECGAVARGPGAGQCRRQRRPLSAGASRARAHR
jgi:histidine ammonia-lyase